MGADPESGMADDRRGQTTIEGPCCRNQTKCESIGCLARRQYRQPSATIRTYFWQHLDQLDAQAKCLPVLYCQPDRPSLKEMSRRLLLAQHLLYSPTTAPLHQHAHWKLPTTTASAQLREFEGRVRKTDGWTRSKGEISVANLIASE